MIGNQRATNAAIKDLKEFGFVLKIEGLLDEYLSYKIAFTNTNEKEWIHQPHLIKKIEKKFNPIVKDLQVFKIPGTPGLTLLKNSGPTINEKDHKVY